MGGTGSQPGCELHLRSMSLINLQPAPPLNASSGASLAATALGNFSSLLWFFSIDRMSSLYPQIPANRTSGRLGRIVLYDVAIMVSSYELQIIRALITNATGLQNLLSNDVIQLIRQQIHAANYNIGSKGNTLLLEGDISLSTPSNYSGRASTSVSTIPGDILFLTFNWFGISGRNVILTASNATISSVATFSSFFPKKDLQDSPINNCRHIPSLSRTISADGEPPILPFIVPLTISIFGAMATGPGYLPPPRWSPGHCCGGHCLAPTLPTAGTEGSHQGTLKGTFHICIPFQFHQ